MIGGLCGATIATLFLVPVMYSVLKRHAVAAVIDPDLADDPAPAPASEGI